ncbi:hypothetical protein LTR36_007691 [Oleoguttula mirabilis]|uniref:Uncharacterized protein n=1 Tax=Oleoguttula mirabilis TaxID=1507867 RepID=A0AAV9JUL9_9PEZI|nr:hypothetical protein LTR36_007691 [Oleoguttula mirabilis]
MSNVWKRASSWAGQVGKGLDNSGQQTGKNLSAFAQQAGKSLNAFGKQASKDIKGVPKWAACIVGRAGSKAKEEAKDSKAETDKCDINPAPEWTACISDEAGSHVRAATKDAKAKTDNFDIAVVNEWIHKAAAAVQRAINNMGREERCRFVKWLSKASKVIGLQALLERLQAVKLEDLPAQIIQYIVEHPYQTAFFVAGVVIGAIAVFAPSLIYGPVLGLMGFGSGGVVAGSAAAGVQSSIGAVSAGSVFALLTSAGAGGYGVAAVSAITVATIGVFFAGIAGVTKGVVDRARRGQ